MFGHLSGPGSSTTREGPRHRLQPLVFLLIALAVMIAGVIWLGEVGDREEDTIPVIRQEDRIEIQSESVLWDPEVETWGPIDDTSRRGRKEVPVAALTRAIERVGRHRWELFVTQPTKLEPDVRGFRRLDAVATEASPRSLRGQPFSVVGELLALETVDVYDAYGGIKLPDGRTETWQGVMRARADLHGKSVPVRFLMVDDQKPDVAVGEPVKLQGVFFKLHDVEVAGVEEPGLFFLGKRLFPSFTVPEPDEIDLSILETVADPARASDRRLMFEEPAFWHLAADILHRPDRDRGAFLDVGGRKVHDLFHDPAAFRGKPITFQARVLQATEIPLSLYFPRNEEGDALIHRVWATYVTTDGTVPLTVLWLEEPDLDLVPSDQVRIRGVFYRLWIYKSSAPGEWTRAPLILGIGSPEKLVIEESASTHRIAIGLLVFAALVVVLMIVVLRKDRRKSELFARRLAAKRRLLRNARGGTAAAATAAGEASDNPPPGDPPPGEAPPPPA